MRVSKLGYEQIHMCLNLQVVFLKEEGVVVEHLMVAAEEEQLQREVEVVIQPVQLGRESLDLASAADTERSTADSKQHICNQVSKEVPKKVLPEYHTRHILRTQHRDQRWDSVGNTEHKRRSRLLERYRLLVLDF